MAEPWAYVAEKNGRWSGVIAADVPAKHLKRFYRDFSGFEIKPLADRTAWLEYCNRIQFETVVK